MFCFYYFVCFFLGPTANIRSINAKDLREYLDNHYKASRIVVAGAGGVNHEDLVRLTESHLGKLGKNLKLVFVFYYVYFEETYKSVYFSTKLLY